ncbi:unnamed protein product [Clavelina lepadiformis]|uniref:PDZ domain-containing protein n=1 Tax=Clavelina lepadiformis TaxID=159417 RepID=A0ABP0GSD7_CLALP
MYSLYFNFLVICCISQVVQAQECTNRTLTAAILSSIFATIGVAIVVCLILYCCLKKRKKKNELNTTVSGYDNPLVIADQGEKTELKDVVTVTNGPDEGFQSNEVVTVLLDQKQPATNGFDVMKGNLGGIFIAHVKEDGPANNKLSKGDVIESVTVFFDDINFEDAVMLLSNAAPYKVAVTVSKMSSSGSPNHQNGTYADVTAKQPSIAGSPKLRNVRSSQEEAKPLPVVVKLAEESVYLSPPDTVQTKYSTDVSTPDAREKAISGDALSTTSSNTSSCSSEEVAYITPTLSQEKIASPFLVDDDKVKNYEASEKLFEETVTTAPLSDDMYQAQMSPNGTKRSSTYSCSSSDSSDSLQENPSQNILPPENNVVLEEKESDNGEGPNSDDDEKEKSSTVKSKLEEINSVSDTPEMPRRRKREDIVFQSSWRKPVKLEDLIAARLITDQTVEALESGELEESKVAENLRQHLRGDEPIAGLLLMETGEKMSLYDATKQNMVRRGTVLSLLEAQAATGSIIDPYTGERMSVDEAKARGLVDSQLGVMLLRAERAALGFKSKVQDKPLSLFEAMKRKLVVENHGIRLLEAQIATGGIIDPQANHRLPVDVAFERGLFDERLNKILEDSSDDTKGFFDPNTNENLTYLELMKRCVIDKDTSLRLLPLFKTKQPRGYWK